ncbi:uncharacterized protein BYT42DRAFT_570560 [Radiomyces spectabilis]|uniref:uncharacterized protein n=1 Tax=Radiomyces spectabilis TaxID=64574 RepID=UPI0022212685|nr:uncharacterized protein BYT42DRAFT_570560 [Radiomyces spectabilis]KAI8377510.1 hypothetical protein BYT42DRAFT_570560 [Radiomyces spectabilis]
MLSTTSFVKDHQLKEAKSKIIFFLGGKERISIDRLAATQTTISETLDSNPYPGEG